MPSSPVWISVTVCPASASAFVTYSAILGSSSMRRTFTAFGESYGLHQELPVVHRIANGFFERDSRRGNGSFSRNTARGVTFLLQLPNGALTTRTKARATVHAMKLIHSFASVALARSE